MIIQNKGFIIILLSIPILLLIPFIAMQLSSEVNWSPLDFLVMGALLLSTGLMIELTLRKVKKNVHRIILCLLILFALFLIWVELSVGIFGTPFAGN